MKVSPFLVLCALALAQGNRVQLTASGRVCNCDPGQADNVCRQSSSEGYLIVHENCNQFYRCVHGQPVTQSCYDGLLYDPIQERCEWPDKVDCGIRPIVEIEPAPVQPEDNGDGAERPCNCNPSEAPSVCSKADSEGVLIAHESCNQFYQCNHGVPITQNCAQGLLYNAYMQRCDWPDNVDCDGRPIVEIEVGGNNGNSGEQNGNEDCGGWSCYCDPAEAPAICAIDRNNGEIVAHENCNQFYQCVNGKPVSLVCQNGLLFNINTGRCDWPQNVNCGERPIIDQGGSGGSEGGSEGGGSGGGTCNCNPGEAPAICAGDAYGGMLVAHENCNQFYKCDHGVPVTQTCYPGLLYNPYIERCDWPENVDCGDRPIVEIEIPGNQPEEDCEDNNGGNGESEGSGGGSEGGGSGGGTCNCNPGEAPSICSADGSDGVLVAHENCNQFYKCAHGKPVVQNCPSNLLYDPNVERCEWPEKVDCGDRPIVEIDNGGGDGENGGSGGSGGGSEGGGSEGGGSEGGGSGGGGSGGGTCNCNPGEAPGICSADGSEGVLVAHENCNQFYKCAHGEPVVQNCPSNLLYDPYVERCEWPEKVDCGDRPIVEIDNGGGDGENGGSGGSGGGSEGGGSEGGGSEGGGSGGGGSGGGTCNCNPGEAPGICSADGSEGVLVAHENCNQFYKCAHGEPVVQNCPSNLLYDPYVERCEWPEKVDCGDRPIVEIDNGGGDGENGGSGGSGGGSEGGGSEGGGSEGGGSGGGGSGGGTCNCNPGEAPGICSADGSDGVLVAHENCNQFYKCAHGEPVVQNCPSNLLYDPNIERCEWPEKVDCGDRPIVEIDNGGGGDGENGGSGGSGGGLEGGGSEGGGSEGGGSGGGGSGGGGSGGGTCNCNPGEAPGICSADGSEGVLVAHENCNQFYKCAHGEPVVQNCPSNLLYDPNIERCEWPEKVDCGDRPIVEIDNGGGDGENGGSGGSGGGSEGGGSEGGGSEGGGSEGGGSGGGGSGGGTCNCNPGEAPGICSADGSEGVLVAHENCNQFYKCAHGEPVVQNCPSNLLYDPNIERCEWPEKVDCGDRPIVEIDNGGGDGENGGSGGSGGGSEGGGSEGGGSEGGGSGGGGSGGGTCNCNPGEAPGICSADGSDGVLVAHENCNQFYKCAHGEPVVQNCPSNLLYDPNIERCEWPEKVDCGDRPIVEIDNGGGDGENGGSGGSGGGSEGGDENNNNTDEDCEENDDGTCNCNPSDAENICQKSGSDGDLIAHENCNQFYKCAHGVPVPQYCPPGLLYDPRMQRCDWPYNFECGNRPIVEIEDQSGESDGDTEDNEISCNCNPAEAPTICAADNSESVLVAHEKCNYFYKCSFGKPVAIRCNGDLLYNPYSRACDWSQNVECENRIISDSSEEQGKEESEERTIDGHCDPSQAPAICAATGSENVLVAHENCNKFYVCQGGLPLALQCATNLLYNPAIERCDWPQNVDCGDRTAPEIETPGGECACDSKMAYSLCAADNSNGKFVAHEKCDKFYLCVGGIPTEFSCPTGLFYEPYSQSCNWPSAVNCDGRDVTSLYSFSKHLGARRGIF